MYTKIHKNAATLSSLTSMFWDGKADVGQLLPDLQQSNRPILLEHG